MNKELTERAKQIDICLKSPPLPLVRNVGENPMITHVVNLGKTPMIETYHGAGQITAYLKDDMLIAWHYGSRKPSNAPQCYSTIAEASGTQLCFQLSDDEIPTPSVDIVQRLFTFLRGTIDWHFQPNSNITGEDIEVVKMLPGLVSKNPFTISEIQQAMHISEIDLHKTNSTLTLANLLAEHLVLVRWSNYSEFAVEEVTSGFIRVFCNVKCSISEY